MISCSTGGDKTLSTATGSLQCHLSDIKCLDDMVTKFSSKDIDSVG